MRTRWRTPGRRGADGRFEFSAWIRDLRDRAGRFSIRDRATKKDLLPWSSVSRDLYSALTRHLQSWNRGVTFRPETVEVAVELVQDLAGIPVLPPDGIYRLRFTLSLDRKRVEAELVELVEREPRRALGGAA